MTSRIPPLLAPYTRLPPSSALILLTSVLGASTNWLVLRFLHDALVGPTSRPGAGGHESDGYGDGSETTTRVVFVSFMRDWEFWREEARRAGLDLPRLAQQNRFRFVDGLTGLICTASPPSSLSSSATATATATAGGAGHGQKSGGGAAQEVKVLGSSKFESIERDVIEQIEGLKEGGEGRVVLVVDQPDLVLAVMGEEVGVGAVAGVMGEMVLTLREHVHSTLITTSADLVLVESPTTPLEINHAAFVVGLAHLARFTVSLRLLDTGAARDVSGILRITRGGDDGTDEDTRGGEEVEERELLYFVGGDGGVRVFERGA